MKRIFPLICLSLLLAGHARTDRQQSARKEKNGINLSLWKNLSTQRTDTVGSTFFNLGIFSAMNRLNGLGVNVLGAVTGRDMNGVQISGISNMVGGSMRGVQVAGITNINGNNLSGLSVSGLVGITGNHARGMVFSGLANITGDNSNGVIVGGLLNITGEKTAGVQLSGLANISGGNFSGVTMSGLLNVVGGDMKGLQIAGLGNITGGTSAGVQLSPLNVAVRAKGLQIGLVNYYKEKLDGFQLGLVNANPDTKVQMMFFGGNTTKLNLAARFKNKLFYTILGGGTHFLDFSDKFSGALFYRAGLELPVCKQLFISGDLGYQHVETFKNKDYGFPPLFSPNPYQPRIPSDGKIRSIRYGRLRLGQTLQQECQLRQGSHCRRRCGVIQILIRHYWQEHLSCVFSSNASTRNTQLYQKISFSLINPVLYATSNFFKS